MILQANMMDDSIQSIQIAPNGVVTEIYPEESNESSKIDLIMIVTGERFRAMRGIMTL